MSGSVERPETLPNTAIRRLLEHDSHIFSQDELRDVKLYEGDDATFVFVAWKGLQICLGALGKDGRVYSAFSQLPNSEVLKQMRDAGLPGFQQEDTP